VWANIAQVVARGTRGRRVCWGTVGGACARVLAEVLSALTLLLVVFPQYVDGSVV